MYQVISYQDRSAWENEVEALRIKDPHYYHQYGSIYQKMGDGDPFLFIYEDINRGKVLYTFIKRLINLPFVDEELYDIITPLGFGGPLYESEDKHLIYGFRKAFEEYCQNENIISEFTRFHPLLQNHRHLEELMDIVYDREMVLIDLNQSVEEILNRYHKKHLQSIKKAEKSNLEFRVFTKEAALEQIEPFYNLYKLTMDKVKANSYYYFSPDYFSNLLSGLSNESLLGTVFVEDKMISAAVCMFSGGFLHYHLACSDKEKIHLGTNMFQLHNLALWGKKHGCHSFFLGGGHRGRDTLFRFKHRFNLEGAVPFFVGKKIHNMKMYNKLVDKWMEYYLQDQQADFFPAYRPVTRALERAIIR